MSGLSIKAQVVDVRSDSPSESDRIWVDTQVWMVLVYSRVPCPHNLKDYPKYIKLTKQQNAVLVAGTVQAAEIARCIEHQEKEIYEQTKGSGTLNLKSFRGIPDARKEVVKHIGDAWQMLGKMAQFSTSAIVPADLTAAAERLEQGELLDGGDAVQLVEARRCGMSLVLSDDSDFASVDGITLLTANERVLRAAATQGKTIRRRRVQ